MNDDEIVEGKDYFYANIGGNERLTRIFRLVSERHQGLKSQVSIVELTSAGSEPFSYRRGDFKNHFIPKPEFVDPQLRQLARIFAMSIRVADFKSTLHERLIALEI